MRVLDMLLVTRYFINCCIVFPTVSFYHVIDGFFEFPVQCLHIFGLLFKLDEARQGDIKLVLEIPLVTHVNKDTVLQFAVRREILINTFNQQTLGLCTVPIINPHRVIGHISFSEILLGNALRDDGVQVVGLIFFPLDATTQHLAGKRAEGGLVAKEV